MEVGPGSGALLILGQPAWDVASVGQGSLAAPCAGRTHRQLHKRRLLECSGEGWLCGLARVVLRELCNWDGGGILQLRGSTRLTGRAVGPPSGPLRRDISHCLRAPSRFTTHSTARALSSGFARLALCASARAAADCTSSGRRGRVDPVVRLCASMAAPPRREYHKVVIGKSEFEVRRPGRRAAATRLRAPPLPFGPQCCLRGTWPCACARTYPRRAPPVANATPCSHA
jgi:hypothetical protein